MRLLFATSIVPDGTLASGYEIANAAIVDALRRAGVEVTILGFCWPGKTPADPENTVVLGEVDVRNENASVWRKAVWTAKAVLSGHTVSSVKLRIVSDEAVRRAIAKHGPFDAYILNSVQFAAAFESVLRDRPSLFVAHNVEFQSAEENARTAKSPVQRLMFRREARLLRQVEARLCENARFVFTLAEQDRLALGVASAEKSTALALVTRLDPPPANGNRTRQCDAALIGTWTWQPNRVGLDWFLEKVVPHLPASFTFQIAGRVPADVKSSHSGVRFVGRVPDAEAFVRSAAVIPLISKAGTGVQLKTIETFELGLPSVATTSSLRGIRNIPQNCVVTDDPVAFAAALQHATSGGNDLDGTAFFRRQRAALDDGIRLGLNALGLARHEAAA